MPPSGSLKIWLIKVAEPTPLDGQDVRLFRYGMLANHLVQAGHEVTWWHSTVHHQKKIQRYETTTTVAVSQRYTIIFLHAPRYTRSVSFRRVLNQALTAREFRLKATKIDPPDIIVCCLPPLELCREAIRYGMHKNIPVILDVQDLWPDAFLAFAPSFLRSVWKLFLTPWFRIVTYACRNATAITGTTDAFVSWARSYGRRSENPFDKSFPLAYQSKTPDRTSCEAAEKRWAECGLALHRDEFLACFFGLFGRHYEIELVIDAARRIRQSGRHCRFVLCGTGEKLEHYKKLAAGCDAILFPGWVGEADIWTLLQKSSVGLCPYRTSATLSKNIPNKPIEYFSAGLPVVSSLEGELKQLLTHYRCGLTYPPGDGEQLIKHLVALYDNPMLRKTLSHNAAELFRTRFAAETVYADMARHIETIALQ